VEFIVHNLGKIILAISAIVLLALGIKNYIKIKAFILEVRTELTKVSWSTRQELMSSTVVVIVITAIMAAFIGVIDICLSQILSFVFK